MRWFLIALLFFLGSDIARANGLRSQLLYGKAYVSLNEWARGEKLDFVWKGRQSPALLTNRWTKLQFTADSPIASINGVQVWLFYPVVAKGTSLFVSEKDIEKTLEPILNPVKAKAGQQIRTIGISAGHGGRDPGYVGGNTTEKEQTLLLAKELRTVLQNAGLNVFMTRSDDRYFPPEEKAEMAGRAKVDLFINLHFNQASPLIKGVETYALPPAGIPSTAGEHSSKVDPGNAYDHRNALLAYQIHKAVVDRFDVVDRGVRRARFIVLREAKMPAVLLEAGFLSNREEAARIRDPKHRKELALAIHDGIMAYKKLVERGAAPEKLPLPPAGEAAPSPKPKTDVKPPTKSEIKPETKPETKPDSKPQTKAEPTDKKDGEEEPAKVEKDEPSVQPELKVEPVSKPPAETNAPPTVLQSRVPAKSATPQKPSSGATKKK
ncbi:MAG TPA: N-acetylmuramoyl-L-alanine amidase [Methylomirabilota bacterium]|nr:N-acetylmuramoyl-L-alanine amidase [Methylomirabilota bacterium]